MSLLLVTSNTNPQTVTTNGVVELGSVIRKYCKKINNIPVFLYSNPTIYIQQPGIYEVSVNATFTGTEAGVVTLQLAQNGTALNGAFASETITTADTEFRSVEFNYPILVNNTCILNQISTELTGLTILNTGIGANISNITVFVTKKV